MLVCASTVISFAGCAHEVGFDVRAKPCLNPADGHCVDPKLDSRVLEVRIYQLRREVDPCRLQWEDFVDGREEAALRPYLADPSMERGYLRFQIARERRRRERGWQVVKGATHVLVVTVGRHRGPASIEVAPISALSVEEPIQLSVYDACIGRQCDFAAMERCK